jgi:hypothetical protein
MASPQNKKIIKREKEDLKFVFGMFSRNFELTKLEFYQISNATEIKVLVIKYYK